MKNNSLKKEDISKAIKEKLGFSLNFSKNIINDLLLIFSEIIKNEKLVIKNIGTIKTLNKKSRLGRNPKTKEPYIISERKSLSYTPSKILKDQLDKL